MPLTVLVDREERIAISHGGDVGLLISEISAPRRKGERAAYLAHRSEFVLIKLATGAVDTALEMKRSSRLHQRR